MLFLPKGANNVSKNVPKGANNSMKYLQNGASYGISLNLPLKFLKTIMDTTLSKNYSPYRFIFFPLLQGILQTER
jgi:hypothetical protein